MEYTGRNAIKITIKDGSGNVKKVKKVFPVEDATFVVTDEAEPKLYAAGGNTDNRAGLLGLGHSNAVNGFELVSFNNADKIVKIEEGNTDKRCMYILTSDSKIYLSGNKAGCLYSNDTFLSFTEILNNDFNEGDIVDETDSTDGIKDFITSRGLMILKNDGTLWAKDTAHWHWNHYSINTNALTQYPADYGTDVKNIYKINSYSAIIEKTNGDLYYHAGRYWVSEGPRGYLIISKDLDDYYNTFNEYYMTYNTKTIQIEFIKINNY